MSLPNTSNYHVIIIPHPHNEYDDIILLNETKKIDHKSCSLYRNKCKNNFKISTIESNIKSIN